jgi:hypothetical protein
VTGVLRKKRDILLVHEHGWPLIKQLPKRVLFKAFQDHGNVCESCQGARERGFASRNPAANLDSPLP